MHVRDKSPTDSTRRKLDRALDKGIKDMFLASDPVVVTESAPTLPEEIMNIDPGKNEKQPS